MQDKNTSARLCAKNAGGGGGGGLMREAYLRDTYYVTVCIHHTLFVMGSGTCTQAFYKRGYISRHFMNAGVNQLELSQRDRARTQKHNQTATDSEFTWRI